MLDADWSSAVRGYVPTVRKVAFPTSRPRRKHAALHPQRDGRRTKANSAGMPAALVNWKLRDARVARVITANKFTFEFPGFARGNDHRINEFVYSQCSNAIFAELSSRFAKSFEIAATRLNASARDA